MIRDWETYVSSARERRISGALVETLYLCEPAEVEATVDAADLWLGATHFGLRLMFRALLLELEVSPLRHGFGARAMSTLTLAQRHSYLRQLEVGSSLALDTWKAILGMAFFGSENAHRYMGRARPVTGMAQIVRFPRVTLPLDRLAAERAHRLVRGVAS